MLYFTIFGHEFTVSKIGKTIQKKNKFQLLMEFLLVFSVIFLIKIFKFFQLQNHRLPPPCGVMNGGLVVFDDFSEIESIILANKYFKSYEVSFKLLKLSLI